MSAFVDVRADVGVLPGGDHCRLRDELDGAGGRQLPHVVGHRGSYHRLHQCPDGA